MRFWRRVLIGLGLTLPAPVLAQAGLTPADLVGRWVQVFPGYEIYLTLYSGGTAAYEIKSTTPRLVSRLWDIAPDSIARDGRWVWLLGTWSLNRDTLDHGSRFTSYCPCRIELRRQQLFLIVGAPGDEWSIRFDHFDPTKPMPPARPYWWSPGDTRFKVWTWQEDSANRAP